MQTHPTTESVDSQAPSQAEPASAQQQPTSVWAEFRRWNGIGMLIVAGFFGGSILWSSLAPLASAVVAAGTVKVDSSRKKIQHVEGGVIRQINVRDGDRVSRDQVLVRLDETRAGAAYGVVRDGYLASLAQQARLTAERDQRAEIEYPPELRMASDDPKVAEIVQSQNAMFQARRISLSGEIDILDRQIVSLRREIDGLVAQQKSKEEQIASLDAELAGLAQLLSSGLVEKTRVRNIEREIAELQGERGEHISAIAAIGASISEKELKKFQTRKTFHEEVVAELRKVQTESFDLAERAGASRHVLEQTELRAPVDGTVVDVKVHTPGGVIAPGEVLMEVVPISDRLIVEAKVSPEDIDRLGLGLPTGVKFHAFDRRSTPELNGQVSYVAADAMQDEKTGMTYFTVRVEVPDVEVQRLGERKVQPGMVADVFIRTGERTFLAYLFTPLLDSFARSWRER